MSRPRTLTVCMSVIGFAIATLQPPRVAAATTIDPPVYIFGGTAAETCPNIPGRCTCSPEFETSPIALPAGGSAKFFAAGGFNLNSFASPPGDKWGRGPFCVDQGSNPLDGQRHVLFSAHKREIDNR